MKATGMIRPLDPLGRVVLPKEIREILYMGPKEPVEFFVEGNKIYLRKYEPLCIVCKSGEDLCFFKGKKICKKCIEALISE